MEEGQVTVPSQRQAIRILEDGHRSIRELVARLRPADLTRPATIGGGDWSARDLLSHLTSWDQHALDALHAWARGEPAPVQLALRQSRLDDINAEHVAADRNRSAAAVRRRFDDVHRRLVGEIRALPKAAWEAPPTARARRPLGDSLGRILVGPAGPFAHASAHLKDLRAFIASLGGERPAGGR